MHVIKGSPKITRHLDHGTDKAYFSCRDQIHMTDTDNKKETEACDEIILVKVKGASDTFLYADFENMYKFKNWCYL